MPDRGRSRNQHAIHAADLAGDVVDEAVAEGTTYHYRARISQTSPYAYLGSTLRAPGDAVTIPVWAAPQVRPSFGSVTWHCPVGASKFFCEGELELTLEAAETGESLAGSVV